MPWVCWPNWRSLLPIAKTGHRKPIGRIVRHYVHKHAVAVGVTCVWIPPAAIGGIAYGWPRWIPGGWLQGAAPTVPGSFWTPAGDLIPSSLSQGALAVPEPASMAVFFVAVVALLMVQAMKRRK